MATATQSVHRKDEELDPEQRSSKSRHFEDALRQKIVGQEEAVEALIDWHRGEEGLVFLRDTGTLSCSAKIDFPVPSSGQLMTTEVRV